MNDFVFIIFLLLWVGLGFFVIRLAARRYFHEPRRADATALLAVVMFVVGLLAGRAMHGNQVLAVNPGTAPVAPAGSHDVSARCRSATATPKFESYGNFDGMRATANHQVVADGGQISSDAWYELVGYGADKQTNGPVAAVCLVIDQRLEARGIAYYGSPREDVVRYYHHPQLRNTGFVVGLPPGVVTPGHHRIEVATVKADGSVGILGLREVEVR